LSDGSKVGRVAFTRAFNTQYAHARDIGLDCLADRFLEIAETPLVAEKRVQKADGSVEITTADAVDRSRLTVPPAECGGSKDELSR